jgi:hypothetical protein
MLSLTAPFVLSTQVVDSISAKSESIVAFRLISVDVSMLQDNLSSLACGLRNGLLEALALKWHTTNRESVDK